MLPVVCAKTNIGDVTSTASNIKLNNFFIIVMIKNFLFFSQNRQFGFEPKKPYDLAAAEGGGGPVDLQFPHWCAGEDLNLHAREGATTSR